MWPEDAFRRGDSYSCRTSELGYDPGRENLTKWDGSMVNPEVNALRINPNRNQSTGVDRSALTRHAKASMEPIIPLSGDLV